jgi:hypothetical protein
MIEFASVVDAVRCVIEVQEGIAEHLLYRPPRSSRSRRADGASHCLGHAVRSL